MPEVLHFGRTVVACNKSNGYGDSGGDAYDEGMLMSNNDASATGQAESKHQFTE